MVIYNQMFVMDSEERKVLEEEVRQSEKATWKKEVSELNPEMCLEIHRRVGRQCPLLREVVLMAVGKYLGELPSLL